MCHLSTVITEYQYSSAHLGAGELMCFYTQDDGETTTPHTFTLAIANTNRSPANENSGRVEYFLINNKNGNI